MKSTGRKAASWSKRTTMTRDESLIAELIKEPTRSDVLQLLESAISGEYDSFAEGGDDHSLSAGSILRIRRLRAAIRFVNGK